MPRVEIGEVVITVAGAAVSGASVQVNSRGAGAATVYTSATGGATNANPLTTDSSGRIEGHLEEGSYDLVVSGTGISTYTQQFEAARGSNGPGAVGTGTGDLFYTTAANTLGRLAITANRALISGTSPVWGTITNTHVDASASIAASKLEGYTGTGTDVLRGDGTWGAVTLTSAAQTLSSSVAMTTAGTFYNAASLSLSSGTWLIGGNVVLTRSGGIEEAAAKIWDGSSASAISGTEHRFGGGVTAASLPLALPPQIVSPSATLTYYLSAVSGNASTTLSTAGASTSLVSSSFGNTITYLSAVKLR